MFRSPSNGNGYGQPHSTTNYHRTYSGEHVTKVAQRPCHAGGAVLQHHVVHKESFKKVDGVGGKAPANRRYFDNYPVKANNAMAVNHHGGGSHHRYESYEETYEESCERRRRMHTVPAAATTGTAPAAGAASSTRPTRNKKKKRRPSRAVVAAPRSGAPTAAHN